MMMLFLIINDGGALDNAHRFKPLSPLLHPPWPGLLVSLPGIVRNINIDTNTNTNTNTDTKYKIQAHWRVFQE